MHRCNKHKGPDMIETYHPQNKHTRKNKLAIATTSKSREIVLVDVSQIDEEGQDVIDLSNV